MSSENQSSSGNAEGSGTLIHQEQSEGTLNLDVGSTDTNKLHDPQQPSQSDSITNAEPDTSDKSKDDEKDKGESVDKKKKGKDAEKDKNESVDKKKKVKDAENESSSNDSKKNKNELNMREDGNDLMNETAKTQANDTHFRPRVDKLVSSSRATLLANQFSLIPEELCVEVAEIFKAKALLLLKHRSIEWDKNNSEAILQILKDPQLDWSKDEFLEAMGRVSQSSKHNLLLTFPPLLNYWFDSRFKTLKTNKLPEICRNWYFHLIELINGSDLHDSNDSKFIFAIYKNLSDIFPIVGKYENIFNDMLKVTVDHVMNCAVSDILSVTPQIATLEKEISVSYGEMVKTMLRKSVHKIDNNLIKILLQVCGCDNEILDIQSALSEDIVCSVMTNLEAKGDIVKDHTKLSTTILNLLNTFRFWRLIFNATGRVEKLYSHPYVKQVQRYIHEFAKVMIGEDITLRSLNEILKYDTDILHQFFNFSINNKEVISKDLIKKHRKDCHGYLLRMDQLRTFYDRFCPIDKVKDVQKFLDDITNRNNNLEYLALKDALSDNHWGIHKKNMNSSRRAHRIANSHGGRKFRFKTIA
ncbi:14480_t:CDS:2 [Funneliformis caledonium]|uniref:14480_t:CDS:1 n=1 Tax=Funneliformis caledonium TaxID=1117310 RepID=A0A9N8VC90_9GLOM|nr:14480_t:CDS:2 [Funneliformis caledonium]